MNCVDKSNISECRHFEYEHADVGRWDGVEIGRSVTGTAFGRPCHRRTVDVMNKLCGAAAWASVLATVVQATVPAVSAGCGGVHVLMKHTVTK